MGHRCGIGAEPHGEAHAELDRERGDIGGEGAPADVGLGPHEEQDVAPVGVLAVAQLDGGPREAGVHAVDEVHRRPPGAVVDEGVGVPGRHELGLDHLAKVTDRGVGSEAGVDPTVEAEHEDGFVEGGASHDLVQRMAVLAHVIRS